MRFTQDSAAREVQQKILGMIRNKIEAERLRIPENEQDAQSRIMRIAELEARLGQLTTQYEQSELGEPMDGVADEEAPYADVELYLVSGFLEMVTQLDPLSYYVIEHTATGSGSMGTAPITISMEDSSWPATSNSFYSTTNIPMCTGNEGSANVTGTHRRGLPTPYGTTFVASPISSYDAKSCPSPDAFRCRPTGNPFIPVHCNYGSGSTSIIPPEELDECYQDTVDVEVSFDGGQTWRVWLDDVSATICEG